MTRRLVLIHGRAQQKKDSIGLKKEWVDTLRKGLRLGGLTLTVTEVNIKFPYYGDTLFDLSRGMKPAEAARVIVRGVGASQAQQDFIRSVLEEVRQQRGISKAKLQAIVGTDVIRKGPLNWEWVQGILKAIRQELRWLSRGRSREAEGLDHQQRSEPSEV